MKIVCIGRNYAEHIRELGNERPSDPVLFLKPETALVRGNRPVAIPPFTTDLHHEVELVLRISKEAKEVSARDSLECIDGLALGIDFTARDLQADQKSKGLPWEIAKSFDDSAPVSDFLPLPDLNHPDGIEFSLSVNGNLRQKGNTCQMIFPFAEIIRHASRYFRLLPGDLIYTGTPAGVASVKAGDHLEGFVSGKKMLDFRMV